MLDIRWPIGIMFTLVGAMLAVFGVITARKAEIYRCSLDININLIWGVVLLVFGVWMLAMARKASAADKAQKPTGV